MKEFYFLLFLSFRLTQLATSEDCQLKNEKLKCEGLTHISKFADRYLAASLIDLSKNSIALVPSESFKDFTNSQYVNLSRNAINRIEQGTFKHNQYEWIDISHNKLTTLGREVLPADRDLLKSTLHLYLHDNPWDCTCAIKWLVDFIKDSLIRPMLTQPKCFTPKNLKGEKLVTLEDDQFCVIQECLECDDAARCSLNENKYECVCRSTYTGNGKFCTDVNECAKPNVCKANEICENFSGGYKCICLTGFERKDGRCQDVNECEPPPKDCGPGQGICKNTAGSYKCICHPGLHYVKGRGCIDINECEKQVNPCRHISHSTCVNAPVLDISDQGFTCQCDDGYVMSGEACVQTDNGTKSIILLAAGFGGLVVVLIIIVVGAILFMRMRKPKQEPKEEFMMAPVTMATPMEFAFMEMPQQQAEDVENEEWHDSDSDEF